MFASILYICISILLCCAFWRLILGFFMLGNRLDFKISPYSLFHYVIICIYTFFAYYIAIYHDLKEEYFNVGLLQDSIYTLICILICLVTLHVLSVLDFYIKKVPNILLIILFTCSNMFYLITHDLYNGYPFMVLGIAYGIFFILHLAGNRQYIGEGDIWIIVCLSILLESFFTHEINFIFELLCCASIMAICYYYILLWRYKKINIVAKDSKKAALQVNQIPFIPFLSTSFLCVSVWHAA